MDVAFKRVNPGDDVPPPPKELKEWAANTAGGTAGGMAYGAARGYGAVDPAHAHLAAIVAKRHRWMRAAHEATMGGLRLGSFVAVFSAVQLGSASHRGAERRTCGTRSRRAPSRPARRDSPSRADSSPGSGGGGSACSSAGDCASHWATPCRKSTRWSPSLSLASRRIGDPPGMVDRRETSPGKSSRGAERDLRSAAPGDGVGSDGSAAIETNNGERS